MKKEKIIEEAIRELTEQALQNSAMYQEMQKESLMEEITQLSIKAKPILENLEEGDRKILIDYYEKTILNADSDCQFLYVQGAKDCVQLLKILGVI